MKIESILKRDGGTKVTLGTTRYHFKPDELDRHVAEVENPDHAKVFLGIPEGYRSLDPLPLQQVSLDEAMAVLKAQFPNADFSALTSAAATPAPTGDAEPAAEPEGTDPDEPDEDDEDEGEASQLADLSDDEIRAEFEKLIGRKPHANMLRENMEAQILAALAETSK
ncbi:hypothetical protein LOS78_01835 [Paracoccus sp. MA]|uniref:hypothetical protein n=1 Tax=Paracoccus sp. MA TaxID=2895796 RepID=UPI001E409089|nr:hypothetical protein [Paracoccus sp. MA]UFM64240.1 hypothetical protein LOS78_01835 [Paracoccus sp. MA]